MYVYLHRRDLRIDDLTALDHIMAGETVLPLLILDPHLLEGERHTEHSGRNFLAHVARLGSLYRQLGAKLQVMYGDPAEILGHLAREQPLQGICFHPDATPYAVERDKRLRIAAKELGLRVIEPEDQLLIDIESFQSFCRRDEPYKVFTPFYRQWKAYLQLQPPAPSRTSMADYRLASIPEALGSRFAPPPELWPNAYSLEEEPAERLGFFLEEELPLYTRLRDDYAEDATSRISRHLNCGALSIRQVATSAMDRDAHEDWTRQLAWRDFYYYEARLDPNFFRYEELYDLSGLDPLHFEAWSEGRTGIPIIDAAMRQLLETGWMPNRLRMVTAMFLTKQLGCPFPLGEKFFRDKLSDYDRTLNRGGWLWSSSLGFDAAPYFRIMNPVSQSQKLDPTGRYIRRWLPELADRSDRDIHQLAPDAIVDLKASRARAISLYKEILSSKVAGQDNID